MSNPIVAVGERILVTSYQWGTRYATVIHTYGENPQSVAIRDDGGRTGWIDPSHCVIDRLPCSCCAD